MRAGVPPGGGFTGSAITRHLVQVRNHEVPTADELNCAGNLASPSGVYGNPPRAP